MNAAIYFITMIVLSRAGFSLPLDNDSCTHWKEWMYIHPFSQSEAKMQYDTLRLFIERCAKDDEFSYQVFGAMDGAVQLYAPNDTTRFNRYRDWLISILYLNPSDAYFCNVLMSIGGTYQYGKYPPTMAALAVLDNVRKQAKCYGPGLDKKFTNDSLYAFQNGWDPTNLPPLDSLGLGFLLGASVATSPIPNICQFSASPSPFHEAVTLYFVLNRTSYVAIEIFNLLGKAVWESKGKSFIPGTHELPVPTRSLPRGTLYARISTGFHEVKTIKIIKD